MNAEIETLEAPLLSILGMYIKGEPNVLIFVEATILETKMNLLINKQGLTSAFDRHCSLYLEVFESLGHKTTIAEIQHDEVQENARGIRFIEKCYEYPVTELEISQRINRLIEDYVAVKGKVLPEFMLYRREHLKRWRLGRPYKARAFSLVESG